MDRTQSNTEPDTRSKMNKEGEDFEDNNRRKQRSGRTRARIRKRLMNSLDRKNLETSKKAQPSDASLSPHQDLLCDEPEVMTEEQTSHSETLQDTSQKKKRLENLKSEELKALKSELQTVSETHTVLHLSGAALEAHTKAEQLETDLVFERMEVQKLLEKLSEKEASHQAQLEEHREETRKIAAALKKAEDLLETERHRWQQDTDTLLDDHSAETCQIKSELNRVEECLKAERYYWHKEKNCLLREIEESRAFCDVQLDEQECKKKTLAAALMNVEQKFESCQVEWQEEKTSLIQDMRQEANEAMERCQASHQAQLEEHREETGKIAAALKKAEDLLETECLDWQQDTINIVEELSEETRQMLSDLSRSKDLLEVECFNWQKEKDSLLKEMEESRALYEVQLDEQKCKNKTLATALINVEQKFESCQLEWQEEKTSLIQTTEGLKNTVQDMQRDANEAVERCQASHQAQLEEHREETRKISAALKKAEDLLETGRLGWQQDTITMVKELHEETHEMQSDLSRLKDLLEVECFNWQKEKDSLLKEMEESRALSEVQLDEQKCQNKTLAAALMNVEQKFESCQLEWQEEKTSLIQTTEGLKNTVQDMQQEANEAVERCQASHQAQLEEHREETRKISAALKKAEDLLETERLGWQHDKISLLEMDTSRALFEDQLEVQIHKNTTLAAALMNAEQKCDSCQVEWQEEKTSLIQDMQQEANEAVERCQASHQAQLEEHREETRKISAALKKAEDCLDSERHRWQQDTFTLLDDHSAETCQIKSELHRVEECLKAERFYWHKEKNCLLREIEESRAFCEVQLDEQKCKNKTLAAALTNVEQKFESCQVEWQEEKTSLIQDMRQEAKEAMERCQASHQAQLEEHREETRKISAALKKAEDLLETERLGWQQDTITLPEIEKFRVLFEDQLEEQNHENKTLAAALMNVDKKLQNHLVEWQEEKTSLIQATEGLEKMLQEKEKEWEEMESSMKSQLEDLMSKKKRKRKWLF
ncbi:cingulin-like isoform X1 [Sparus aurata]|uniref:cingulin-like isoform X1 n=1 Tax=Sparus aurata TaxID=8175 RepID=UPI0011C11F97|nr:cingulin-like isoform X1 [Sparus aurata]